MIHIVFPPTPSMALPCVIRAYDTTRDLSFIPVFLFSIEAPASDIDGDAGCRMWDVGCRKQTQMNDERYAMPNASTVTVSHTSPNECGVCLKNRVNEWMDEAQGNSNLTDPNRS